jgi:hypothetical protein
MAIAAWPKRFVYVCSATRHSPVNMLPLIQADIGRIASVAILVGTSGSSAAATDHAEALRPAQRLRRLIRDWAPTIVVGKYYTGDPSAMTDWFDHLNQICRQATPEQPVLFNIKGGTKEMAIGGLVAAAQYPHDRVGFLTVAGDGRVDFIDPSTMQSSAAKVEAGTSLGLRLMMQGYYEIDREWRLQKQEMLWQRRADIARYAEAVLPILLAAPHLLNNAISPVLRDEGKKEAFNPGLIAPYSVADHELQPQVAEAWADALSGLDGIMGLEARTDAEGRRALFAAEKAGAKLIKSGWLEAYLYHRVRDEIGQRNDVQLAANLKVAMDWREGSDVKEDAEIGEFDLAVMAGGQLHLVDAKTGNLGRHSAQQEKSLDQAVRWKQALLGNHGAFALVAPRVTEHPIEQSDGAFLTRARQAGISLFLGPSAVDDVVAWISRLVTKGSP